MMALFDFSLITPLNDENKQKHLFYLNYKQSDANFDKTLSLRRHLSNSY